MGPASEPSRTLEAAFAEHHAFVRERLRCLGVATRDLDDATQDVFEVLVRRVADYDPDRPIRAWMAGMARRVARRYRDRGRRSVVPLDERVAIEPSPEERAARSQAWEVLQGFLAELEPERWAVFVLSEVEGLRGSEIAAELGINQNTVYARLRSARAAFDRVLQRRRARENRRSGIIWLGPASRWRRWGVSTALASTTLGVMTSLGAWGSSCSSDDTVDRVERSDAELGLATMSTQDGADIVPSAPVEVDRATWQPSLQPSLQPGGSGFSTVTAAGTTATLSFEDRYRLDGDSVTFERSYVGDDDVSATSPKTQLKLDGLEPIEGTTEWQVDVGAGETTTVRTILRAAREGVVQLVITTEHAEATKKWVSESGRLRPCEQHECDSPIATSERLSGERIDVLIANDCEVRLEFVLFAGYPELLPPDTVVVHSLEPHEQRTMQIDSAQWILRRSGDGRIGIGAHVDGDGEHVIFSGSAGHCDSVSTGGREQH